MKILYDYQIFSAQKYGGISRYFYELINEYHSLEKITTDISLVFSNNHYISNRKHTKHLNLLPNKEFRGKHRLLSPINKIDAIKKLKLKNYDLFHPTYYDPYFLKYIGNKPFVLTVYDMTHEKFTELFSKNDLTTKHKKLLAEKASKIIAISQSTKNDLVELFDIDAKKIEVVHLATSMEIDNDFKLEIELPKRYILFVGLRQGYKNFELFIEAVSQLLHKENDLFIVCVGGSKFNHIEINLFNKLNIKDKVLQFDLDDSSMSQFYNRALLFVFPSLYEGFGIPILESFACRCPLVCSNTSSLPEVAGNAAEYFDPSSKTSIYNAIENVLLNENYRQELVYRGREILKNFSWEKTALETKKVYEGVVK